MKIRSKATLTLRAMLARRYGFGASPNKPPLCHLWPQRHSSLLRFPMYKVYHLETAEHPMQWTGLKPPSPL